MKYKRYVVRRGVNRNDLETSVEYYLRIGYTLVGGLVITSDSMYVQAVALEDA